MIYITKDKIFEEEEKYLTKVKEEIEDHILFLDKNPTYATNAFGEMLYGDVTRIADANENRRERAEFANLYNSPYTGRMDFAVKGDEGEGLIAYIGERSIYLDNKFLVYDWRTPVGQRFYMKNELEFTHNDFDYRLLLRRALFIKDAELVAYENEYQSMSYGAGREGAGADVMGADIVTEPFLIKILNEKRQHRELTPIIVSMQEEQNNINRLPFENDIIVQGCAGSGKTMVLLHRLSYLKFNNPKLNWERVKIITPNEMFNMHINALSERLELSKIERITVEKYYSYLLAEYEEHVISRKVMPMNQKNKEKKLIRAKILKNADKIISEKDLSQELLSYIYSDEFEDNLNRAYKDVWDRFEEEVSYSKIDKINEKFGFNKNIVFDDNTYKKIDVYLQTISAILSGESSARDMIAQREERKNSLLEKISRDHGHIARYERERDTMHRLIISKAKSIVEKNLERGEPNTIKNASRINYKTPNLEWHLHLLGIPHDAIAGSYRNITAYNDDIAAAKQRIIDHTKGVGDVEKEIEEIKSKTISEEEYNSLIRSRNRLLSFDVEEIFAESFAQALGEWSKEIAELKNIEHYRFYIYAKLLFFYLMYGKIRTSDALLAIDEGQDISPCEYKLMNTVNGGVIFNIYGDTNQLIKVGRGTDDWDKLDSVRGFSHFELPINYRNTIQIADYSNEKLDMTTQAVGINGVDVEQMDFEELPYISLDTEGKRVAIICKDLKSPYMKRVVSMYKKNDAVVVGKTEKDKVSFIDIESAKGLEFDKVYAVPRDMTKNEQYIAYTRALSELIVIE